MESIDKIICGLGNPEEKYKLTRHNIGWRIIDLLKEKNNIIEEVNDCKGLLYLSNIDNKRVLFIKSLTGMNSTGDCIKMACNQFNIDYTKDLLVVLDDISLPFGKIRMRLQGSSGHHNGLSSILEKLNTEKISRIKIGIDKPKNKSKILDYVLGNFTEEEELKLRNILQDVIDIAIIPWIKEDNAEKVMNIVNK